MCGADVGAGLVILYGVNSAQTAMMNSMISTHIPEDNRTDLELGAEFKNDPRNPGAKTPKPVEH